MFVGLVACAHGGERPGARTIVSIGTRCPADLRGARVELTELDGAVAIDFTRAGDVGGLRASLAGLGDRAAVHALDGGVRVTLSPDDPREYDELSTKARRAVFELRNGDCSCMARDWLALVGPDLEIAPRP